MKVAAAAWVAARAYHSGGDGCGRDSMRQYDHAVGIVIRSVDFSETSKVVTLFTREFGKLGALAKGGRRAKGSFEGSLDVLSVFRIGVIRKPSADLDLLTEARLEERFAGLGRDLQALYAGFFAARTSAS